ncbi:MAG: prepilin-type N-terminal cleavage/methylation domain-containing protein [Thermodesulfovibrionia bacterium]|nr:prepilin-type N-terminal cleavage/methylation domain-containing protein [Thermodesulfovibrionia bacterium]
MTRDGVTLVELVVVVAIIAIVGAVTAPGIYQVLSPEGRLKANANNIYSDIIFAQNEAIQQGAYTVSGGTLRQRKVFVVFTGANSYSIWRWEDLNGNNVIEAGEFDPSMAGGADAAVKTVTMGDAARLFYSFAADVTRSACENGAAPTLAVTYGEDNLPPCGGNCRNIEFDANGFADSPGTIYITNGTYSYALNGNSAGLFDMCRWDKTNNQWIPMH